MFVYKRSRKSEKRKMKVKSAATVEATFALRFSSFNKFKLAICP